jgi:hypothetical protein
MTRRTSNALAGLAARLTDPEDRERYAAIVLYLQGLPPEDEFRHLAELMGLVSLIGQRLPDALGEFLAESRAHAKAAADFHAQVDARLADLPRQIAEGVEPATIARSMSESFRQQVHASGLQETAALLKAATATMKALSAEVCASLKPADQEYRRIALTLSSETMKLFAAARQVAQQNEQLIDEQRSNSWALRALVTLVVFLVGGVCGILLEQNQSKEVFSKIGTKTGYVQTSISSEHER